MRGIYCVYKQSRSCQLPFCASPIFHFEMEIFLFTCILCTSLPGYIATAKLNI